MTGVKYLQRPAHTTGFIVTSILACCTFIGCESEPPPASGLTEWLEEVEENASVEKAKSDDDIEKPVPSKTGPHPKAVIPESHFDFGQMRVGTHMTHEFTISNEGEAPLQLVAGQPTCKCTQFSVSPNEVSPGESATLVIEWHGKFETTTFQHGGKVYTNDPSKLSVLFNVGGTVDATVVTKPEGVWNAGEVPGKEPITFEGTITSRFLAEMNVTDVTNESEFITVEYEGIHEAQLVADDFQSGCRFHITVQPDFPVGILEDTITVKLAEVEEPIEIPVVAQRRGDIRFIPMKGTKLDANTRTLRLGQFPASRGRTGEFMLMVNGSVFAEELRILQTESSPKSLKVNMVPIGKPNNVSARYKVSIEVPPGGLRTEYSAGNPATVLCHTNHPTEQEITVRLIYSSF
jgi:hypothetical protein